MSLKISQVEIEQMKLSVQLYHAQPKDLLRLAEDNEEVQSLGIMPGSEIDYAACGRVYKNIKPNGGIIQS